MNIGQQVEIGKLFFEEGIPGFGHLQFFHLLQKEEGRPFFSLQSLEEEGVSFLVVDPFFFFSEYEFSLPGQAKASLHIEEDTAVMVVNIVTIRGENNITVNLKAPIVINQHNRMAKQVILNEENYEVRQPLFHHQTVGKE
ncbi:flagellar assembly protein FliW [Brevibacillus choshinensis]|uniref:flagellar assembly protein FliW n=1 Tax=Brevibacillus choshinensis TaxID=54911 RepID=UPI002E1AD7D5|nr:flagellar assembly protein FliW [Brevibacillus choshinensis]MED4754662.1 flagellar assembly protein FliW [Brevibacillus choshinensis]